MRTPFAQWRRVRAHPAQGFPIKLLVELQAWIHFTQTASQSGGAQTQMNHRSFV